METTFLKEYKELCLKHGYQLKGCGECGSAWLQKLGNEEMINSKLSWVKGYEIITFADNYCMADENRIKDNF